MSGLPSYLKVYEDLKKKILGGEYPIGDFLPTEPEIEALFSVSRTTVRRAMELLSKEGFIEVKQGRGTRVLNHKARQDLKNLTSVTETLRRRGFQVATKSMHIDTVPAGSELSQCLGVELHTPLARIQRIQTADGTPIAIMRNYLNLTLVPGIEKHKNQFTGLYQFLEEHYGLSIDSSGDKIFAKNADFTEAELLCIPVGAAILCIHRVCYFQSSPICVDHVALVGDRYELETSTSGRRK